MIVTNAAGIHLLSLCVTESCQCSLQSVQLPHVKPSTHQRRLTAERPCESKDEETFPTNVWQGPQVEKLCGWEGEEVPTAGNSLCGAHTAEKCAVDALSVEKPFPRCQISAVSR